MRCLPSVVCPSCYNTTCQQSWHAPLAVKAFCTTETSQVFTTPPPTPPTIAPPCHHAFVLPPFHSLPAWSISCQRTPAAKLRFWSKVQTGSVTPSQNMISQITILILCRPAADRHTPWWCQLVMCVSSQVKHLFCGFTSVAQQVLPGPSSCGFGCTISLFKVMIVNCEFLNLCLLLCAWKAKSRPDWVWMPED